MKNLKTRLRNFKKKYLHKDTAEIAVLVGLLVGSAGFVFPEMADYLKASLLEAPEEVAEEPQEVALMPEIKEFFHLDDDEVVELPSTGPKTQ